jgi:hypothetical protein
VLEDDVAVASVCEDDCLERREKRACWVCGGGGGPFALAGRGGGEGEERGDCMCQGEPSAAGGEEGMRSPSSPSPSSSSSSSGVSGGEIGRRTFCGSCQKMIESDADLVAGGTWGAEPTGFLAMGMTWADFAATSGGGKPRVPECRGRASSPSSGTESSDPSSTTLGRPPSSDFDGTCWTRMACGAFPYSRNDTRFAFSS